MTEQTFFIRGIPKAQGRPRFSHTGRFMKTYDPPESRAHKENIAAQIVSQGPRYLDAAAIVVSVYFHMPRPKSLAKRVRHHIKKPDLDNLIKGLLDACKGIVWRDDSQIIQLTAHKVYTSEDPATTMTVAEVPA